jgi:predicted dehydrogenase
MKGSKATGAIRRRDFVRGCGAALGVFGLPAALRSASPNAMLQVACIGVGGFGVTTSKGIAGHPRVKIVALCDVDEKAVAKAATTFPDAARHKDWRTLLGRHADAFDAVAIAVPDHMHAPPAFAALRAQKHLYLQKPMAGTLRECRVLTQEAARAGVVTQLGNQGRSAIENRMTVALIRSGAIGKVKEVLLWENKPLVWWPKNTVLRTPGDPVPAGFDWDLWLGVREPRPYLAETYHPHTWRAWVGFGSGELGDMGCHHFDTTFDALRLTAPLRVRQATPGSSGPLWSRRRIVELVFPGTPFTTETVKLTWHDGDLRPDASRIVLPKGIPAVPESGTCWIGTQGTIFKNFRGGRPFVLPEEGFPAEKYPRLHGQDHYRDWVDAIFAGRR